jgi:hypothetical protein
MKNLQARFWLSSLLLVAIYLSASSVVLGQFECTPSITTSPTTGALTAGDPLQTGRVVRDGRPSSCTGKTNTLQNATPVNHDAHNFTAPISLTPLCATINFNHTGCGTATTGIVAYSTFTPGTPQTGILGDMGFSSTGTGSLSFPLTSGQNFTVVVYDVVDTPTNLFCASYSFTITYSNSCRQAGYDANNDGFAEMNLFRPATGQWFAFNSNTGVFNTSNTFGITGDTPLIGDYTGDGNSDISVFRPSNNTWYGASTPVGSFFAQPWGTAGDIPVPGDYDRDGKMDITIWRPTNGTWYTLNSSTSVLSVVQWGTNGDTPYTGDFDGDLANDFGIARNGVVAGQILHQILESNFAQGFFLQVFYGAPGDEIVIGDYDGDAKSDIAVFRPATGDWHINRSTILTAPPGPTQVIHWGQAGDIPQPADYDADKKTDVAVYRPSNGAWYTLRSSDSQPRIFALGTATDVPITANNTVESPVR